MCLETQLKITQETGLGRGKTRLFCQVSMLLYKGQKNKGCYGQGCCCFLTKVFGLLTPSWQDVQQVQLPRVQCEDKWSCHHADVKRARICAMLGWETAWECRCAWPEMPSWERQDTNAINKQVLFPAPYLYLHTGLLVAKRPIDNKTKKKKLTHDWGLNESQESGKKLPMKPENPVAWKRHG